MDATRNRFPLIAAVGRLALAALLLGASGIAGAASIAANELPRVEAATFEVVAAKPTHDPLKYERALPLDRLPYQQRTDAYYSIGTAFALGGNRYVTAAHVLMVGNQSLWGAPELRDSKGHVYPIGQILKFSLEKDFVVFSLKDGPQVEGFTTHRNAGLNHVVFAVGNALGTGVVIRDGLYTSDSPEEQDGRWKWMRFSAAASPGNSGGPLLDESGAVIGVVLAKSPNENLNYALPIGQVLDAPAGVAEIDRRLTYGFANIETDLTAPIRGQFALPLTLQGFYAAFQSRFDAWCDRQLKTLLQRESDHMFPRGDGSEAMLTGTTSMDDMPSLLTRDGNGQWSLSGNNDWTVRLKQNGYLSGGKADGQMLFHLRRPDNVTADQLYGQPAELGRLLAAGGIFHRKVGNDSIKITGIGEPASLPDHDDGWGRRWQVRSWPMPYSNHQLVVMALPVPDGYVGMMRLVPSAQVHDVLINMQALADFAYVNYDGTLAQWKDFLRQRALLPAAFARIHLAFDYGKRLAYSSDRVGFAYTPALQQIDPDSMLTLGFGFFKDGDRVVWDVGEVWLGAREGENNTLAVIRNVRPASTLDTDFQNTWNRLREHKHPYDGVPRVEDDVSKVDMVAGPDNGAAAGVLYGVYYHREGVHPATDMQKAMHDLLAQLRVVEKPVSSTPPARRVGKLAD